MAHGHARCYVVTFFSAWLEHMLEHPSMERANASPSRVAVSKLVSKHRLSYYCDIYAPDVPVDGLFTATFNGDSVK